MSCERIRTAIIHIKNSDMNSVVHEIESLEGKIVSQTSGSNAHVLFSLLSSRWDYYEDVVLPRYSTRITGEASRYTETCVYAKSEIENASYFVLEFTHSPFDIGYREFYDFSMFHNGAFGRPRAWITNTQPPIASGLKIKKLTRSIGITLMGAVLVRDDAAKELDHYCDNELVYTRIVDSDSKIRLPWSSLWSTIRMPSMSIEATGILHEGYAPDGVAGGTSVVFDTLKEGYKPVYTQGQIESAMCGGNLDIAFTRECYGPWPETIESVVVAPYPKMVISNRLFPVIKKLSPRGVNYIPIQIT